MQKLIIQALLALCFVCGVGTPAMALVADPFGLVPDAAEDQLERDLGRIKGHRMDAWFTGRFLGSPGWVAEQRFKANHLGDNDAIVVVAIADRQVGAHLGKGFVARGLTEAKVARLIKEHFIPAAKRSDYTGGVKSLAQAINAAARPQSMASRVVKGDTSGQASTSTEDTYSSPPPAPHKSEGGGAIVFVLLGGVGLFFLGRAGFRILLRAGALTERLMNVKELMPMLQASSADLGLVEWPERSVEKEAPRFLAWARPPQDDTAAWQRLANTSQKALERHRRFVERVTETETELGSFKLLKAEMSVSFIEREVLNLGAILAGLLTAAQEAQKGLLSKEEALALPQRMAELALQVYELQTGIGRVRTDARYYGARESDALYASLVEARRVLMTAPVDPFEVEARVAELQIELTGFEQATRSAAERSRDAFMRQQANRAAEADRERLRLQAQGLREQRRHRHSSGWNWGSRGHSHHTNTVEHHHYHSSTTGGSWSNDALWDDEPPKPSDGNASDGGITVEDRW